MEVDADVLHRREQSGGERGVDFERTLRVGEVLGVGEVDVLEGDATRARTRLGWCPRVDFGELVAMMVDHDLELAQHLHGKIIKTQIRPLQTA